MRDPGRINRILALLRRHWLRNPDLRLGQIVINATPDGMDPFYVEDDDIEAALRREE